MGQQCILNITNHSHMGTFHCSLTDKQHLEEIDEITWQINWGKQCFRTKTFSNTKKEDSFYMLSHHNPYNIKLSKSGNDIYLAKYWIGLKLIEC